MLVVTAKIKTKAFDRAAAQFIKVLERESQTALTRTIDDFYRSIRADNYWNNKTGKLVSSFRRRKRNGAGTKWSVYSNYNVALFLDKGTKPRTIYPTNGPYLTFKIQGRWIRAKSVDHPGIQAREYMDVEAGRLQHNILMPQLHNIVRTAMNSSGFGK